MRRNILHNTIKYKTIFLHFSFQYTNLTKLCLLILPTGLVLLVKPLQFSKLQGGVEYERHCPDHPQEGPDLERERLDRSYYSSLHTKLMKAKARDPYLLHR